MTFGGAAAADRSDLNMSRISK